MQITNRRRGCGSFCCMFKDILIMIIVSVIIGIRHHSSHQPYHHQHQGLHFSKTGFTFFSLLRRMRNLTWMSTSCFTIAVLCGCGPRKNWVTYFHPLWWISTRSCLSKGFLVHVGVIFHIIGNCVFFSCEFRGGHSDKKLCV